MEKKSSLDLLQSVLKQEAKALERTAETFSKINIEKLENLFNALVLRKGSLFVSGVGKSGIIARKISSTFSSLGLKSFFLHPVEALHGDLGGIEPHDALILISKSGTTEELVKLMPFIPFGEDQIISLLGNIASPLAEVASIVFDCSVEKEACLNNLAPTTSTTVALSVGDALAVFYENLVSLTKEKFATNHPAGLLGKSLSMKISSVMMKESLVAQCDQATTLKEVLLLMTQKPTGICCVLNDNKEIKGILVEGDIRRALNSDGRALEKGIKDFMNSDPIVMDENSLASEALGLMENPDKPLSVLPIINSSKKFVGVLRIHDLLNVGFTLRSSK